MQIHTFILGPVQTNSYLVGDPQTNKAVVIDPAWDGQILVEAAQRLGWCIEQIWLTHAHFDHLGGVARIVEMINPAPPVALHPGDRGLWGMKGGALWFGIQVDPGPEPTIDLFHGQRLHLGRSQFEVRHTPGHTPGHVIFYCAQEEVVFCGDVIFYGSIGRTDMPGGDYDTLIASIRSQILTFPNETRLLSGHGPETNVGKERKGNPFLANVE